MEYSIRNMLVSDLEFAATSTAAEGWISETADDFENFLAFDPSGCFIAESNSKPIGLCIATNYGHSGFIGELIVSRDSRGKGIGASLLNTANDYLAKCGVQSIFLDGDIPAVPLYERTGFVKICKSLRFTGKIEGRPNANVHPINEEDLLKINRIDTEIFGADRTYFLERKLKNHPNLCKVLKVNGSIKGYVFCKRNNGVISIGPCVLLDDNYSAASLLNVIALEAGNATFRIGILESNKKAVKLIKSYGSFTEGEFSWRMVLGKATTFAQNEAIIGIGSAAKG